MALLILAHSNYGQSLANKSIVEELKNNVKDLEIRNLAELYPDFKIDVKAEQEALLRHQSVVFQFPVNWYNMPAILKQWFDLVFGYGFAYGSSFQLQGKDFITSVTFGSSSEDYQPLGKQHFRPFEFWKNLENTAYLCQMKWHDVVYSTSAMAFGDPTREAQIKQQAKEHAQKIAKLINQ
ncbi:MAG: NAD(P)H-dependent oxidoreductase [Capnocytophaga sp.]|nr:NAD(P)H-dependent oxidoreductase [Capnocytophaga sp.]